ncbi:MAG: efflux transporter outer membrane subunit [Campylobacterales bacterium]|nr:efflux transporter outer membrane subunit [Campylobacterales bacterium]
MNTKMLLAACLSFLLLTGCIPKIDKATVISKIVVNSDLEKSIDFFDDKETQLITDWWKGYKDPQLNKIIDEALSNAPTLKSVEARYAQANSIIQGVESRNMPHLAANASVIRERFSENHIFPAPLGGSTNNQYQPSLTLDYNFDFWNERGSRILAAKNSAYAQNAMIEASQIALSSAICETYLSWNFDEQKLVVLSTLEKTTTEELGIITKQHRLGLIDATEINTKKSALSQITQRMAELHRVIEGKKESICVLAGFLPSYIDTMKTPNVNNAFSAPWPKEIMLNLLAHRSDVAIAKYTALSKSQMIENAKAKFYPNISLSGLIGFTSFSWTKLLDHSSFSPSVGVALSLPLLDWGERNANLQSNVGDYNSSVYDYNQVVIKAANEVVVLLKQSKLIESQIQLHHEDMDARNANETISRKKLHLGLSNKLPYLSAQKTTFEGEIETLSLMDTKAYIQIELIKSLGAGYRDSKE